VCHVGIPQVPAEYQKKAQAEAAPFFTTFRWYWRKVDYFNRQNGFDDFIKPIPAKPFTPIFALCQLLSMRRLNRHK